MLAENLNVLCVAGDVAGDKPTIAIKEGLERFVGSQGALGKSRLYGEKAGGGSADEACCGSGEIGRASCRERV